MKIKWNLMEKTRMKFNNDVSGKGTSIKLGGNKIK